MFLLRWAGWARLQLAGLGCGETAIPSAYCLGASAYLIAPRVRFPRRRPDFLYAIYWSLTMADAKDTVQI